jgi:hypothetical protein
MAIRIWAMILLGALCAAPSVAAADYIVPGGSVSIVFIVPNNSSERDKAFLHIATHLDRECKALSQDRSSRDTRVSVHCEFRENHGTAQIDFTVLREAGRHDDCRATVRMLHGPSKWTPAEFAIHVMSNDCRLTWSTPGRSAELTYIGR